MMNPFFKGVLVACAAEIVLSIIVFILIIWR